MHVQAVMDADEKLIDVFVGEPGALHETQELGYSNIFNETRLKIEELFPNNSFFF